MKYSFVIDWRLREEAMVAVVAEVADKDGGEVGMVATHSRTISILLGMDMTALFIQLMSMVCFKVHFK